MISQSLLKEVSPNYVACTFDACPLHEHCLRWQVGQVETDAYPLRTYVNPHHRLCGHNKCEYYRVDTMQHVAFGMVNFFHEMPHYIELAIKKDLFLHFTRTGFYRMRKGSVPITPDDQALIADICLRHDWNDAPVYDRFEDRYVW